MPRPRALPEVEGDRVQDQTQQGDHRRGDADSGEDAARRHTLADPGGILEDTRYAVPEDAFGHGDRTGGKACPRRRHFCKEGDARQQQHQQERLHRQHQHRGAPAADNGRDGEDEGKQPDTGRPGDDAARRRLEEARGRRQDIGGIGQREDHRQRHHRDPQRNGIVIAPQRLRRGRKARKARDQPEPVPDQHRRDGDQHKADRHM